MINKLTFIDMTKFLFANPKLSILLLGRLTINQVYILTVN